MTPLERRHAAIEATMARYRDKPFQWGKVDCAKVAAFHLKKLGHKILISKAGAYQSPLGAARALKRLGYTNVFQQHLYTCSPSTPPRLTVGLSIASVLVGDTRRHQLLTTVIRALPRAHN